MSSVGLIIPPPITPPTAPVAEGAKARPSSHTVTTRMWHDRTIRAASVSAWRAPADPSKATMTVSLLLPGEDDSISSVNRHRQPESPGPRIGASRRRHHLDPVQRPPAERPGLAG